MPPIGPSPGFGPKAGSRGLALALRACAGAGVVAAAAGAAIAAPAGLMSMSAHPVPEGRVGDVLLDKTVTTFDAAMGTQVEHISADAGAMLWVADEAHSHKGTVYLRGNARQICFLYRSDPGSPIADGVGSRLYCHIAGDYMSSIAQIAQGDPLALRSGRIPFVLPFEGPPDIAALAATAGIAAPIVTTPIPGR